MTIQSIASPEEQFMFLWKLLDQAKGLLINDQIPESKPYLPAVERVQERLTALVKSLGIS